MIREINEKDIDIIMETWKESTIKAHDFIPKEYWVDSYSLVKEKYIPISKTFVYEEDSDIKGFISIMKEEFIGALFVKVKCQGQGIGSKLINFAKENYNSLSLAVYKENEKSVYFYKKIGFIIDEEKINEDTMKEEFIMSWEKRGDVL